MRKRLSRFSDCILSKRTWINSAARSGKRTVLSPWPLRAMDRRNLQISYTNAMNSLEVLSRTAWDQEREEELTNVSETLFKHLEQTGLAPSVWIYNGFLRTYAKMQNEEAMNSILWRMVWNFFVVSLHCLRKRMECFLTSRLSTF